jgi:L-alanine-DL-glutamate epimerase-like enolase superfamily enzyme
MTITDIRTRVVEWRGSTVPLPPHFCTNPMDLLDVPRPPLEELSAEARRYKHQGYRAMKLRFGWGPVDGAEGMQRNADLVRTGAGAGALDRRRRAAIVRGHGLSPNRAGPGRTAPVRPN